MNNITLNQIIFIILMVLVHEKVKNGVVTKEEFDDILFAIMFLSICLNLIKEIYERTNNQKET